ncbi:hypothetical protein RTM1035_09628 [Roseovarius sp. TM1035]|nr:hypothetical protein RTM1035_09628 [Roseovarius sp. TM1035]
MAAPIVPLGSGDVPMVNAFPDIGFVGSHAAKV